MTEIQKLIRDNCLDTFEKVEAFFRAAPYNLYVYKGSFASKAGNLYLLSYNQIESDFANAAVREARGIILEKDTNRIVCYPFDKFFNAGEKHAAPIDWTTATVQQKYDGSIIKVYWLDGRGGEDDPVRTSRGWMVATNHAIDARQAPAGQTGRNFYDLFVEAAARSNFSYDRLSRECTYMFELMHPDSVVVIRHTEPRLVHIGTRNNTTFAESYEDIGVPQVETYPLSSPEECKRAAARLGLQHEGFVVKDAQWRRVKIKGTLYLQLHYMLGSEQSRASKATTVAARIVLDGQCEEIGAYAADDDRIAQIFAECQRLEQNLTHLCEQMASAWSNVMAQKPSSRKDIALLCKKEPVAYFPFLMARATHESERADDGSRLNAVAFFRQTVLQKCGKDATQFLQLIDTPAVSQHV
jgi:hypothetical protein